MDEWIGESQALIPSPRRADAEQAQAVDKPVGARGRDLWRELHGKEAIGAEKIPLPQAVPGIAGKRRIKDARYLWLVLQPGDDLGGMRLVHPQSRPRPAPAL